MLFTLDSLLQWHPPKDAWISRPLLPKKGTVVIGAEPKVGKSVVALNMAYDLSEGTKLLGLWKIVGPQRVLLFDQEVGPIGMQERIKPLHLVRQGDYAGLNLNIVTKDLTVKLDTEHGVNIIKSWIDKTEPNIVIYDPLINLHSQDENDNSAMHRVMEQIAKLEEEYGISSIVVHHFGKPDPNNPRATPNRSRGASTIFGDADSFLSIEAQTNASSDKKPLMISYSIRFDKSPKPTKVEFGDDYVLKLREG